ncbi:IclR family transcriptional regulator domain-containing protein [Paenibacillus beijingensis]|uniref:IclR family transcriptional regulator domain-containing protein n=1 Tax=Paenibacillus beijingensis TaxID=1126833 RepID=UPI00130D4DD2|nr:IclR family transcriptional regulator C-terminal domain-containing protein [Paenibacillus beijingensis]
MKLRPMFVVFIAVPIHRRIRYGQLMFAKQFLDTNVAAYDLFPGQRSFVNGEIIYQAVKHIVRKFIDDEMRLIVSADHNAVSLSAPIRNYSNIVVAALSLISPNHRVQPFQLPALKSKVIAAAKEISKNLGWFGHVNKG